MINKKILITEKIKLWGIVQGVGFRPFVAKCADRYDMKGEVLNIGGLVDVVVTDTKERIDDFVEALKKEKPTPAEIVHIKREILEYRQFNSFSILDSDDGDDEAAMIPSDLAMCPDCLRELQNPDNPRFKHPFISCMVCGPRYTIIDKIPYDRDNTAMIDWPMCDFCKEEYTNRKDRRYHAQTISCHDCGPELLLESRVGIPGMSIDNEEWHEWWDDRDNSDGNSSCCDSCDAHDNPKINEHHDYCASCNIEHSDRNILEKIRGQVMEPLNGVAYLLSNGYVVAMKGVGGYNLLADPLNKNAVDTLRNIKKREQKPFAIMFKDIQEVRKFSYVSEAEEILLKSSARPIILLEHKSASELGEDEKIVNKHKAEYRKIGAMVKHDSDTWEPDNLEEDCEIVSHGDFSDSKPMAYDGLECDDFSEIGKSRFIGTFLPSMGAQHTLLDIFGGPLIVTSANLSNMPIIKDNMEMFELMENQMLISAVLYNKRDIRVRVDDSVMRVIDGQPQMIRRSKGYAPVPLYLNIDTEGICNNNQPDKNVMVLATGGQLKNSFALSKGPFSYVSQYFGDLDSLENQQIFEENIERMKALFRIEPGAIACDMHPLYYTTAFAKAYSQKINRDSDRSSDHAHGSGSDLSANQNFVQEASGGVNRSSDHAHGSGSDLAQSSGSGLAANQNSVQEASGGVNRSSDHAHGSGSDLAANQNSVQEASGGVNRSSNHAHGSGSDLAKPLSRNSIPIIYVQHHHAHVASVMAEHNLKGNVIGVAMDGTGYGTDHNIWGGEFLLCQGGDFERISHLRYVKMIGGDGSMKEAWKSAMCYVWAYENGYQLGTEPVEQVEPLSSYNTLNNSKPSRNDETLSGCQLLRNHKIEDAIVDLTDIIEYAKRSKFNVGNENKAICDNKAVCDLSKTATAKGVRDEKDSMLLENHEFCKTADPNEESRAVTQRMAEWKLVSGAIANDINVIKSSSMGRLFDAVSALLGIKDYNDYEGQCAIMLEDAAARGAKNPGACEKDDLALSFHDKVARMILEKCVTIRAEMSNAYNNSYKMSCAAKDENDGGYKVNQVALTGGVFQNKILMEKTLFLLRTAGFDVYYNVSVSPNDGGIALGQNYIALCKLNQRNNSGNTV